MACLKRFPRNDTGIILSPSMSNHPARDFRMRNSDDDTGIAPCPVCGYPLVVRVDCRGPYFFCLCVDQKKAA